MDEQFYQFEVESNSFDPADVSSVTERGIIRASNYTKAVEQVEAYYGSMLREISLSKISDDSILFISSGVAQAIKEAVSY